MRTGRDRQAAVGISDGGSRQQRLSDIAVAPRPRQPDVADAERVAQVEQRHLNRSAATSTPAEHVLDLSVGFRPLPQTTRSWINRSPGSMPRSSTSMPKAEATRACDLLWWTPWRAPQRSASGAPVASLPSVGHYG